MTDEQMLREAAWLIACELDRPSVYMGGPSPPSIRKAECIVQMLFASGFQIVADESD